MGRTVRLSLGLKRSRIAKQDPAHLLLEAQQMCGGKRAVT